MEYQCTYHGISMYLPWTLQMQKANVKLSAKKLYSADGFAVKEALKLVTLLQAAAKTSVVDSVYQIKYFLLQIQFLIHVQESQPGVSAFDVNSKIAELKVSLFSHVISPHLRRDVDCSHADIGNHRTWGQAF
jgi:hypothetical protein